MDGFLPVFTPQAREKFPVTRRDIGLRRPSPSRNITLRDSAIRVYRGRGKLPEFKPSLPGTTGVPEYGSVPS